MCVNFWRSMRISLNESNDVVKSIEKLHTFSLLSFLKPNDSVIDFLLSKCEEFDVHLLLIFTHQFFVGNGRNLSGFVGVPSPARFISPHSLNFRIRLAKIREEGIEYANLFFVG